MTENRTRAFLTLDEIEADRKVLREITKKVLQIEPGTTVEQVHDHLRRSMTASSDNS